MKQTLFNRFLTIIVFLIPIGIFVGVAEIGDHRTYVKTEEVATTTPEISSKTLSFTSNISTTTLQVMSEEAGDPKVSYLDFSRGASSSASDPYFPLVVSDASFQTDILIALFNNTLQEKSAHTAIDSGAKIVIGTYPKQAEKIEEYNGGIIFYNPSTISDPSAELDVVVTKKGIVSYATSTL